MPISSLRHGLTLKMHCADCGNRAFVWSRLQTSAPPCIRANAEHAGLTTLFDALLSTDANHTYKPDPRAYQLGVDYLGLAKQDIVFAAFGGWDAAGAKSFGYRTVWVNRFNQPAEELGFQPDRTVPDLAGLLDFVLKRTSPG
jgi:2-haloacid dehalogenase